MFRKVGGVDGTPMRPVVAKPPGFLSVLGRTSTRTAEQTPRVGPRGSTFSDDVTDRGTPLVNRDHQELAASCRRSGMAPTLLLSVSVRCTEHQRRAPPR